MHWIIGGIATLCVGLLGIAITIAVIVWRRHHPGDSMVRAILVCIGVTIAGAVTWAIAMEFAWRHAPAIMAHGTIAAATTDSGGLIMIDTVPVDIPASMDYRIRIDDGAYVGRILTYQRDQSVMPIGLPVRVTMKLHPLTRQVTIRQVSPILPRPQAQAAIAQDQPEHP